LGQLGQLGRFFMRGLEKLRLERFGPSGFVRQDKLICGCPFWEKGPKMGRAENIGNWSCGRIDIKLGSVDPGTKAPGLQGSGSGMGGLAMPDAIWDWIAAGLSGFGTFLKSTPAIPLASRFGSI
jgi:hypothetical protein